MTSVANTTTVRKALSGLKLVALPLFFFYLPIYGISHGANLPTSNITMVTITDNWFNLVGTQTAPPDVKPVLYVVLGISVMSDLCFLILKKKVFHAWIQVARVFNLVAGLLAAVCGELILQHVASNSLPVTKWVKQTAAFGSMISVLMILLIAPSIYEFLIIIDLKTPNDD